jgi:hypothetical protein
VDSDILNSGKSGFVNSSWDGLFRQCTLLNEYLCLVFLPFEYSE